MRPRLGRSNALVGCLVALAMVGAQGRPSLAAAAAADAPYFDAAEVDLESVLPGPPTVSVEAPGGEVETILRRQTGMTPADQARAASEARLTPDTFSTVLGSGFISASLPVTGGLLERAAAELGPLSRSAKQLWNRPRPPLQDTRVKPMIPLPPSGSYPSFHAVLGELWGGILAQLLPACADRLKARAAEIGDDRVMAGVHFPSDVSAGRELGDYVLIRLARAPGFAADLADARQEIAVVNARGLAVGAACRSGS